MTGSDGDAGLLQSQESGRLRGNWVCRIHVDPGGAARAAAIAGESLIERRCITTMARAGTGAATLMATLLSRNAMDVVSFILLTPVVAIASGAVILERFPNRAETIGAAAEVDPRS